MKIGILFDLDGTLLDTLADLTDASNYALGVFGYPPRHISEIRRFVGNGAANQLRLCVPEGADYEPVLAVYKPYYDAHCQEKTAPYPFVLDALAGLGRDFPLAVVSNKPHSAVEVLSRQYFGDIYARGEMSGIPRKPAADMIRKTMADLGLEGCVYVGDSEVDVVTARNAGVPCLSVLWGFRDRDVLEQAGACHFCERPEDLERDIRTLIREMLTGEDVE
jgi:phosphoglycolate phosphatase